MNPALLCKLASVPQTGFATDAMLERASADYTVSALQQRWLLSTSIALSRESAVEVQERAESVDGRDVNL